jgi:hypothetical protein
MIETVEVSTLKYTWMVNGSVGLNDRQEATLLVTLQRLHLRRMLLVSQVVWLWLTLFGSIDLG